MLHRREELDSFKRDINLIDYAAHSGYALDPKSSSRGSAVMRHPNGDKIIVARDTDGHWTYFSVRDDRDNGSIIDFIQHRQPKSLGEVRKALREWPSGGVRGIPCQFAPSHNFSLNPSPQKDPDRVRVDYGGMAPIRGSHDYLEKHRGIPAEVISHVRFADCIRIDARGNAVFPHWNDSGICGYELKNCGFTGFSPGGEKGLWKSVTFQNDTCLVIAESAIDALSHFAIRHDPASRYVSFSGGLNKSQPTLLLKAARDLPTGGTVIIATDNDAGGDKLAERIREILVPLRLHVRIVEDRPHERGSDWNDVLQQRRQ